MPKMQTDYFTPHLGLISDYLAEIFHSELRQRNYTDSSIATSAWEAMWKSETEKPLRGPPPGW